MSNLVSLSAWKTEKQPPPKDGEAYTRECVLRVTEEQSEKIKALGGQSLSYTIEGGDDKHKKMHNKVLRWHKKDRDLNWFYGFRINPTTSVWVLSAPRATFPLPGMKTTSGDVLQLVQEAIGQICRPSLDEAGIRMIYFGPPTTPEIHIEDDEPEEGCSRITKKHMMIMAGLHVLELSPIRGYTATFDRKVKAWEKSGKSRIYVNVEVVKNSDPELCERFSLFWDLNKSDFVYNPRNTANGQPTVMGQLTLDALYKHWGKLIATKKGKLLLEDGGYFIPKPLKEELA